MHTHPPTHTYKHTHHYYHYSPNKSVETCQLPISSIRNQFYCNNAHHQLCPPHVATNNANNEKLNFTETLDMINYGKHDKPFSRHYYLPQQEHWGPHGIFGCTTGGRSRGPSCSKSWIGWWLGVDGWKCDGQKPQDRHWGAVIAAHNSLQLRYPGHFLRILENY